MPSQPTVSELHVDRYLTDFSVAYSQDAGNFVANVASSIIPVNNQSDQYVELLRGYFWRDEVEPRPLGGIPPQADYKTQPQTYNAIEYGLETMVDDRQRANADDPLDLDRNAATLLNIKHLIKRDRIWVQKFWKTGVWSKDRTGVTAAPTGDEFLRWDESGSDPIGDIDFEKDRIAELTGQMPNVLVLGADVRRALRTNAQLTETIKYTQRGLVDADELLASLFGVDRVVTPRAVYNSAAEGATDSFSFIVSKKHAWLGYIDPNPTVESHTAIALFSWTGLLGGAANTSGVIRRGREERASSDWFQQLQAWDQKLISADLGTFFEDAVS